MRKINFCPCGCWCKVLLLTATLDALLIGHGLRIGATIAGVWVYGRLQKVGSWIATGCRTVALACGLCPSTAGALRLAKWRRRRDLALGSVSTPELYPGLYQPWSCIEPRAPFNT